MRKKLLNKVIEDITLEEVVMWTKGVTPLSMGGKKYYYFINWNTKNINSNTQKERCKKLKITPRELQQIIFNQKQLLREKEII